MATTQRSHTTHQTKNPEIGLLANGSSPPWEIAIDETTSGADRWFLQIEGTSVDFYFEIPGVHVITKMVRFLDPESARGRNSSNGSPRRNGSLLIGKDRKMPIRLIKDDEHADRFFLIVGPSQSPIVRFVIAGVDVVRIVEALRQVIEELVAD